MRVVQLANFSADAWIDAARAERVTTAFVVPTMLGRGVDAPPPTVAFYGMRQLTVRDPDGRSICFEHPVEASDGPS